jgi:hypothetical protein
MKTERAAPRFLALAAVFGAAACATAPAPSDTLPAMNDAAERYVKLVLADGRHDKHYLNAIKGTTDRNNEAD